MRRRDERVAKQFGANLHRIRVREGLTQRGLAERASLHRTEIDKLESGSRAPRVDTLFALAEAMETPPGELIEGIEPEPLD